MKQDSFFDLKGQVDLNSSQRFAVEVDALMLQGVRAKGGSLGLRTLADAYCSSKHLQWEDLAKLDAQAFVLALSLKRLESFGLVTIAPHPNEDLLITLTGSAGDLLARSHR